MPGANGGPESRGAPQSRAAVPAVQVRDALAHLYAPGHLQTHPLAALVGGSDRAGRGRALRRALLDAVDALKPPREGAPGSPAARRYQLLTRRYLDGLSPEAGQRELLIGRSADYREHQRAVEAVASLVRDRLGAARVDGGGGPAATATAPPAPAAASGALPLYLTSFVGREAEAAEVAGLLARTRLLTLTGAG